MYTEKVTLRLTPEDKQQLQDEAELKKIPLTTLIRNKVSGNDLSEDVEKEFEPKLISTNTPEYNRAKRLSELKLNAVETVISEAKKLIDLPDRTSDDFKEFLDNPVGYVTHKIHAKHSKSLSFKISKHKLLELMEIDMSGLLNATEIYNKSGGVIVVDEKGQLKSGINIESYKSYTKNNAENKRLELANQIINCFSKAKETAPSIRPGAVKDAFYPILITGGHQGLQPCETWIQGKR